MESQDFIFLKNFSAAFMRVNCRGSKIEETIAIIYMRGDGNLDQKTSGKDGEKRSHSDTFWRKGQRICQ